MNNHDGKLRYGSPYSAVGGSIPFEGNFGLIAEDDDPNKQPEIVARPETQIFYLGDSEGAAEHEGTREDYTRVCKLVENERAVWDYRDYQYDSERGIWRVLASWVVYVQKPSQQAKSEKLSI